MPDDKDEKITDDDLHAAAQEAVQAEAPPVEAEPETKVEPEPEKEEPVVEESPALTEPIVTPEQKEIEDRSNLGRKVKKQEEKIDKLVETVDRLAGMLLEANKPREELTEEQEIENQKEAETERVLYKIEQRRLAEKAMYEEKYINNMGDLAVELGLDANDHKQVGDIMLKSFNVAHTGDPVVDSRTNYTKAALVYMRQNNKREPVKPVIPLRNEAPKAALGVGGPGKVAPEAPAEDIELDQYAARFVAKVGMDKKDIKEALARPAFGGLTKERA